MKHSIAPSARSGKIAALCLALVISVGAAAVAAAALPVNPRGYGAQFLRQFADHDEGR